MSAKETDRVKTYSSIEGDRRLPRRDDERALDIFHISRSGEERGERG